MAPPFTLKLGALDLAPYVRVGNDEGFDPYDGGGFEEPAFIDNPFGEGQGLANVDSRNREMSWPLYLNAATKDAMHTLVRQINQEIRYAARPLRVEWRDQDATNSTYYDVEFARFDPNFRMRPSAQRWLAGVLRVWTQPYGHTATERVIGTGALPGVGSIPLASFAGDIGAQMHLSVSEPTSWYTVGSPPAPPDLHVIALTQPSQILWRGAASFSNSEGVGTTTADPCSIGSTVVRFFHSPGDNSLHGALVPMDLRTVPTSFRLIAMVRCTVPSIPIRYIASIEDTATQVITGVQYVSTVVHSLASAWQPIDFGLFTVNPAIHGASGHLSIKEIGASQGASYRVELGGAVMAPDDAFVWDALGPRRSGNHTAGLRGGGASTVISAATPFAARVGSGTQAYPAGFDLSAYVAGELPMPVPGTSQALFFAALRTTRNEIPGSAQALANVTVAVRERFTFAR